MMSGYAGDGVHASVIIRSHPLLDPPHMGTLIPLVSARGPTWAYMGLHGPEAAQSMGAWVHKCISACGCMECEVYVEERARRNTWWPVCCQRLSCL